MTTAFALALVALCARSAGAPGPATPDGAFEPGAVAPSMGDIRWHAEPQADGPVTRRVSSDEPDLDARPQGAGLEDWRGHAVLVLVLPEEGSRPALELGELVQRAGADRGLVVATVTATRAPQVPDSGADTDARAPVDGGPEPDLPPSSELVAGFVAPGSTWSPGARPRGVVLGPSGEVVDVAALPEDEDRLLAALHDALGRYPVPALERDLGPELREAQAAYFAGDWAGARRTATRLAQRLARREPESAARAEVLVDALDVLERELRAEIAGAAEHMNGALRLARVVAAIERGLPRSDAAEEAEAAVERQRKEMGRATAYRVAAAWIEALPERPLLFPEVQDARSRRYAKRLEALTRTANYTSDLTRRIEALLARHEAADRR